MPRAAGPGAVALVSIGVALAGVAEAPPDGALEIDPARLERTPDVDALLALEPPSQRAPTTHWVAFGHEVMAVYTDGRHSEATDPRLPWIVYIARNHPEAIYRLHDRGVLGFGYLDHLLQFGLAREWHERIRDVETPILTSADALASLAHARGIDAARRSFIDAFFSEVPRPRKLRLRLESLRFAVPAMTAAEVARVVPRLESGVFSLDPRRLSRLLLTGRFDDQRDALRVLIETHAYPQRSMSSYFVDGARLGTRDYVFELARDLEDNAGQPTNFYCAACGLALSSDGLLGSALRDALRAGRDLTASREGAVFVLGERGGAAR